MKVVKFGGSSISNTERIKNVLGIIKSLKRENQIAVVVSAFGGVTEKLIEISALASDGQSDYLSKLNKLKEFHIRTVESLIGPNAETSDSVAKFNNLKDVLQGIFLVRECSPRLLDLTMSFGERLSASIFAKALCAQGIDAEYLNASKLIITDELFGKAGVDFETTNQNIKSYFETRDRLQIVTGFVASSKNNEITTLGRNGSDYTAAIFGAALHCSEIEIWTDVNGVLTADPRMVAGAFPVESMTYDEAMEMSHFGSKVIHPKAMQPALEQGIPILVKNTFNPQFSGTRISKQSDSSDYVIRGISSISDISLLRVQGSGMVGVTGISGRLFSALASENISVILITQGSSEHSICFAVEPQMAKLARKRIEQEFELEILAHQIEKVIIEESLAVIAMVGEKMRGTPGIAAKIFQALAEKAVNVVAIAQGSSELNISVVVNREDETVALNAIHNAFFRNGKKSLHLFLIGPGLVGSELLKQIHKQLEFLRKELAIEIDVNAIANSKKMIFEANGIPFEGWQDILTRSSQAMDLEKFVGNMHSFDFKNKVLVDCTASDIVTNCYERVLSSGIAVATSNKKACSGSYERYKKLRQITRERDVKFLYETNVGASLPIICTLRDLILSGDEILKIETVISGTISFIFNSFDGNKKFSEIVEEAKKKGYTEPNPRDDLNGLDVARKLLIMARETGLALELEDIVVENILPQRCQLANSVEEFFEELQYEDDFFETQRSAATQDGKVLRYVATLEGEEARVSLQAVDGRHPFYSLSGNENIIAVTTQRYREKPLVIRGPGAGADLTAAGVFTDIIRILD